MNTDKRIDTYILKSEDFAQPILNHLRALVQATCPEVEETIKWSFPHFDYKGEMMCSMAAFKQHCAFGFWKAALMKDKSLLDKAKEETSMGHLGKITSLDDLPSDKKLIAYIKEAMKLNEDGIKIKKTTPPKSNNEITIPEYFLEELKKNKAAQKFFDTFTSACKREYIVWITDAKTEATREKRMTQAMDWISEGKKRNWKYER
jgi:uncharacterized protein YdeI (YjbR/CyaY-like superfamily)